MQYGRNFLAVSDFSFFGGNVNVNQNLAVFAMPSYLISYMHMFLAPEQPQASFQRLPLYIPFERLVCTAISSEKSWHPKKQK